MTTALQARHRADGALGQHRRHGVRRRSAEKALAVLVLVAAFTVTVVLLGLQWLGNQATASSAPYPSAVGATHTTSLVHDLSNEVQTS